MHHRPLARTALATLTLLALGGHAVAAIPTQWSYRILFRVSDTPGASFNLPQDSSFSGAMSTSNRFGGTPFGVALDHSGNAAFRYSYNLATGRGTDAAATYLAATDTLTTIASVPQRGVGSDYVYWDSSIFMRGGNVMLKTSGLIGSVQIDSASGTTVRDVPLGGPLSVTSMFGPQLADNLAVGYTGSAIPPGASNSTLCAILDSVPEGQTPPARTQTVLASCSYPSSPYSELSNVSVNGAGQMGVRARYRSDYSKVLLRLSAAGNTTIAALRDYAAQGYDDMGEYVAINNAGSVLFTVRKNTGSSFVWQLRRAPAAGGLGDVMLSNDTAPFNGVSLAIYQPKLNSLGWACLGASTNEGYGIYLTDGTGSPLRLFSAGQTLTATKAASAGQTTQVTLSSAKQFFVGPPVINDLGQVAFLARLSDDSAAVIIATPVLPSPACNKSDITDGSGSGAPDGQHTGQDVVVFFQQFFSTCTSPGAVPCNKADLTDGSGSGPADGQLTGQDVVIFFQQFFIACDN